MTEKRGTAKRMRRRQKCEAFWRLAMNSYKNFTIVCAAAEGGAMEYEHGSDK